MRLLVLGDIVGRAGRTAVTDAVPALREQLGLDLVIVNGENAAGGFGLTGKICAGFYQSGIDVITTGNHVWDQRELVGYIDSDPKLLRPINFPKATPGRGAGVYQTRIGEKIAVMNVMGRIFMDPLDDPFEAMEVELSRHRLGGSVQAIVIDFHAEATSEKQAAGHFVDGRATMLIGTHSHIPTADTQILPGGTAYQSDLGMCGDYDSVIGMKKEEVVRRFRSKLPGARFEPAEGEATICGILVETDPKTGLAKCAEPVRIGGRLSPAMPAV